MEELNQFQFKSLSNACFDLAKAWFIAGIIAPFGAPDMSLFNKTALLILGVVATWFFIQLGLLFGRRIQE